LSNCDGKKAYVRVGKYRVLRCYCTVSGEGCSCIFSAPTPFTNGTAYTHYAQVDLNGDGTISEGEEGSETLTVLCQGENQPCDSTRPCCSGYYCKNGRCERMRGGGCPILKVWDGKEFVRVEKLDIHSRGEDTTYSTSFKMKPFREKTYRLVLEEALYALWEGSHIDHVKLIDGEGRECKLIKAEHSKLGDVTDSIEESDDSRVETKPGESLELTFEGCGGEEFTLSIEGYNPFRFPVKLALSYTNIIIMGIVITLLIVIVLMFKRFMVKR
jgi:hypothetical protein